MTRPHLGPSAPLRQRRTRRLAAGLAALVTVALAAVAPAAHATAMPGPPGPEGIPLEKGRLLAPLKTTAQGRSVDGISCDASEQVAYHVHSHLAVFVDGRLRPIPAGIGMVEPALYEMTVDGPFYAATRCYYWLHVHAPDGVIHIESPTARTYTLGDFFDIWGQPLGSHEVAGARGVLHVFVDGRPYRGNPRNIRLGSHVDIQIDVGAPVVRPYSIDWRATKL